MNDSLIDREPEVEQALERINVRWNGQRTEQALASLQQRMRRRALATRAGIGVVGVAAFAWLLAPRVSEMFRSKSEPRAEQIVVPSERPPVTFYDGSQMTPLDQQTEVSVLEASPDRIVAGVLRGGARFEVTHRPSRVFLAQAGGVSVEALGTIFSIERLDPGVWVSVTRGHVRVQWEGGSRELAVGEADWFPPRAEGAGGVAAIRPENLPPGDAREAGASPNPTSTISDLVRSDRWKALAKQGKNDEAYTMLAPLPSNQVRDPEELLLAADVARLSGHPKQA
ncbi:MAG TPA: FecR domain-containing protein, partial [Polyangiaceae bacterium]|nr:FecR domain-containing protein [Polyangiaceae bacterium]